MSPNRPPQIRRAQDAETVQMIPIYRASRYLLTALLAGGLFLLIHANPLAQTTQVSAPKSQLNDLAGVIDEQTRTRLEGILERLKEKSNIGLYVAVVDTTDGAQVSDYSQRLAREWNVGAKTSRGKSLLLVVSAASKTSFTQYTRAVQTDLPDGVLGEMTYRMSGPLNDGRFSEAVEVGIYAFVNAVAEKMGFNAADLEKPAITAQASAQGRPDGVQPVLISANDPQKSRPRVVSEVPRPEPTPTEIFPISKATETPTPAPTETPTPVPTETPAETPAATPSETPSPAETPASTPTETAAPTPSESPSASELPKTDAIAEAPKTETPKTKPNRKPTAKVNPAPRKLTPQQQADLDADELEAVDLTLTLPLAKRVVALKEFLDTHPDSKSRGRATEYLISSHAELGDQAFKAADSVGGLQQLMLAIDEGANYNVSDELFTQLIAPIPMNLYARGEHIAAFNAAQEIETKFGQDAKRLLNVAAFFLSVERGADVARVAEAAVKQSPDMPEAHRLLAVGYHISLRLDEAAAEYKRTLELDPTSRVSRGSLADLYRASGKTEEALALYNEQLASDPKDRAARAGKVIALLDLDRQDEANRELEAALSDEPRNLPLLTGAAYWFAAHNNNEKALDLAQKAVAIESRYTWAQIALARALVGMKRPLEAERAMRYAQKFGKFPTMTYELATVLSSMGLYEEAVDTLRSSFTIKDDQINTYLAGQLPASNAGFSELLTPERRASIYQKTPADNATNANSLKALLAFNAIVSAEKIDESAAVAAARAFASGTDDMRAFRQLYAASRLMRYAIAYPTVIELTDEARKASDDALKNPGLALTMAVQADEFSQLRSRAIASGTVPDVSEAPPNVLANILKGRIEDLTGWALLNQAKSKEAVSHLKLAAETLPAGTPAWRSALWHLGSALEDTDHKTEALDSYIKSYNAGEPDAMRRSVIEQLYKKINGSLDGLEQRIAGVAVTTASPETPTGQSAQPAIQPAAPSASPETAPSPQTSPVLDPPPAETPKAETPKRDAPLSSPMSEEEAQRLASARTRTSVKITGKVVDADKVGIANATLVLISPTGMVLTATTDNDGNYSFMVAAPSQKTYRIIPSKDGYSFAPVDKTFAGLLDDQREIDFVATKQ